MKRNSLIVLTTFLLTALLVGVGGYFYFNEEVKSLNSRIEQLVSQNDQLNEEADLERKNIVVLGDTRTGHEAHERIINLIETREPTAVFHTGDLVDDGNVKEEWDIFNQITANLRASTDFYPALGNHENDSINYYNNFELPNNEKWYSVDVNKIHFIVLDSTRDLSIGSEQYNWLENDLKNVSDDIRFIIAVFHHPPYSTGEHDEDEKSLRSSIIPLFEKYGVDAVFNGHDHNYERALNNGIYYIVAGGGGAPLRDQARTAPYSQKYIKDYHYCMLRIVSGNLEVSVYDDDNEFIDGFVIQGG